MPPVDWVTKRSQCSPVQVFETLRAQIEKDVEIRNGLRPTPCGYKFLFIGSQVTFTVIRDGNQTPRSVKFDLTIEDVISARDEQTQHKTEATLTLNDEGECRLKVGIEQLECWQFRRRMLEDLFFRP
jgi:hypothetical protein